MAATIVRRLTPAKKHHSIRSVAKDMDLMPSTVLYHFKKKELKNFKKRKRDLISRTQQEVRQTCCTKFRKTYRKTDLPNFLFVDECYVTV